MYNPQDYKTIVLSGGSTKLPLHLGFWDAIDEQNIKPQIIIGNSAGSIISAAMACKMPKEEMKDLLFDLNFKSFAKITGFSIFLRLIFKYILKRKKPIDAYELFLKSIFKDLKMKDCEVEYFGVIGHSLERKTYKIFSNITDPEMPIYKAVRISSSVPFLFDIVKYDNEHWVDGGLSKDFPIDVDIVKDNFIAHLIDSPNEDFEEFYDFNALKQAMIFVNQIVDINRIESMKDNQHNGIVIKSEYNKDMLDLNLSKKEKIDMVATGYANSKKELKRYFKEKK